MSLKNDYIRITSEIECVVVEVLTIKWKGPHTPEGKWEAVQFLPSPCSAQELEEAIEQVLANRKFFGVCKRCNEHRLKDHMHNQETCSRCAEKYLGINY